MAKLNILCLFFALIALLFLSFGAFQNISDQKQSKVIFEKSSTIDNNILKQQQQSTTKSYPYQPHFFNETVNNEKALLKERQNSTSDVFKAEKESIVEGKSKQKGTIRKFKNSDEMMSTLFPHFKKEFGAERREKYKWRLPVGFIRKIPSLSDEQKQEYQRLRDFMKQEKKAFSTDRVRSEGEVIDLISQIALIKEDYNLKVINLLTKEQQAEFANILEEALFPFIREQIKNSK